VLPPPSADFATIATRAPVFAALSAATAPAPPNPITTTPNSESTDALTVYRL